MRVDRLQYLIKTKNFLQNLISSSTISAISSISISSLSLTFTSLYSSPFPIFTSLLSPYLIVFVIASTLSF
jgi:hypothetical protein